MVSLCVNPPLEWWYVNQNKKTHIKMHYLTVQSMKSAAVLIEGGAFALFFCPCRRAFGSSSAKKKANYPEGGMGAPGIDWFISSLIQWNLEIMNLYRIKSLVLQIIFFTPVIVKYMEKSLDIMKPHYKKFCQFLGPSWYWGSTVAYLVIGS